jgi:hypothetical protein
MIEKPLAPPPPPTLATVGAALNVYVVPVAAAE